MDHEPCLLLIPIGSPTPSRHLLAPLIDLGADDEAGTDWPVTVHGVVPGPGWSHPAFTEVSDDEHSLTELAIAHMEVALADWASRVVPDAEVTVSATVGRLSTEVATLANRIAPDLVVVVADDHPTSAAAVRQVARTCPVPLCVLRPGLPIGNVVAAVEPDDGPTLTGAVLDLALQAVRRRATELHVVHAWQMFPGPTSFGSEVDLVFASDPEGRFTRRQTADLEERIERAHEAAMTDALQSVGDEEDVTSHLIEGAPADAIERLADQVVADLIVLGSSGSAEAGEPWFGAVVDQLLSNSARSLLLVPQPQRSLRPMG